MSSPGSLHPASPHPPSSARLRQRLLGRIHRRYQTVTESRAVGPLRLMFTRIADPDRVLDEVAAEEDRIEKLAGRRTPEDVLHLPYWAELWDSAAGVGQFLIRVQGSGAQGSGKDQGPTTRSSLNPEPSPPDGPSVLDLGCGMGLAGTVATALGSRVLFADLEEPALLFARLNSLPFAATGQVRARRLNWRIDHLGETFDLILGADILYERKQWEYLDPFWRSHLAPGGSLLLGEPGRQTGDLFPAWITARGWALEQFEEPVTTRPKPIRLFRLRLPTKTPATSWH